MKRISVIVFLSFAVITIWGTPGLAIADEAAATEKEATEQKAVKAEKAATQEKTKSEEVTKTEEETPAEEETTTKEDSKLNISRLIVCVGIDGREPVGATDTFSASTEEAYCFLEAKDITEDTTVSFVWYLGENVMATVYLPLKKSARWRTHSSKKITGLKGDWKVEIQDDSGAALKEVSFKVK